MIQVSVLMSIYNEPISFVESAIQSICNQTFDKFEFLIVVDNPDNNGIISYLIKKSNEDSRIKILVNKRNLGLAKSLNYAASCAQGKYLARMDADDISNPERIELQLQYIEEHKLDMVSCLAYKIDENENITGEINTCPRRSKEVSELLRWQNIIVHPTIVIRTDVFRKVGGYRNFSTCQDYDLWLRLVTNRYQIGILDKKLLLFRRHNGSISATKHFNQCINEKYIRLLYKERNKNNGMDSFSKQNLEQFLKKYGYYNEKVINRESQCLNDYKMAMKLLKSNHYNKGIILIIKSIKSSFVREKIYMCIKRRVVALRFKEGK